MGPKGIITKLKDLGECERIERDTHEHQKAIMKKEVVDIVKKAREASAPGPIKWLSMQSI